MCCEPLLEPGYDHWMFPFVRHEVHRRVLLEQLEHALDQGALGVLLCGSVARGTAGPRSDLDLRLYWLETRLFEAFVSHGVLVERHGHTLRQAALQLEATSRQLFAWTEGRILHDPTGQLLELQNRAGVLLAEYKTPPGERQGICHWLRSTLLKLDSATDNAQRAFLVHTTTWKIAEGVCAVNNLPAPPSTLMWELLPTLPKQPEGWLEALLLGSFQAREVAFRRTATWLLQEIELM